MTPDGKPAPRDSQETTRTLNRLTGCTLPVVRLKTFDGFTVDLQRFMRGLAVIYFYRGAPEEQSSDAGDLALHAGYARDYDRLRALRVWVVGISSEPADLQHLRKTQNEIPHELLCDEDFSVAEVLGIPTELREDGRLVYEWVALAIRSGMVVRVFYPILDMTHNASQVVAFMTLNG